jgi:hypothetical protein
VIEQHPMASQDRDGLGDLFNRHRGYAFGLEHRSPSAVVRPRAEQDYEVVGSGRVRDEISAF